MKLQIITIDKGDRITYYNRATYYTPVSVQILIYSHNITTSYREQYLPTMCIDLKLYTLTYTLHLHSKLWSGVSVQQYWNSILSESQNLLKDLNLLSTLPS